MSGDTLTLRNQIREDHLTCPICYDNFNQPKALPCLHTFCQSCLRDYVVGRGYESSTAFPCPVCREDTQLPATGVDAFPNNHLVSSLSHTMDSSEPKRPVPKPRKSLGQTTEQPQPYHTGANNYRPELPPPYSSVADTNPDTNNSPELSDDPSWMVVPRQDQSQSSSNNFCEGRVNQHGHIPNNMGFTGTPDIGWNINALNQPTNIPQPHQHAPYPYPGAYASQALYPTVPLNLDTTTACTKNLLLRFGKQGSSVRDFLKPVGLAVSKDGQYIISDSGGDQSKIFIYNSGGELTTAFKAGYKVKDVALTNSGEIFAAVQSNTAAIRHFTIAGQCRAEYGKGFAYETPSGVAVLSSGGAVISGTQNHCLYLLTNQMKLAHKFGRKGNGDGYFLCPAHVAVDSKDHIIVTDKQNNCVQVFNSEGKFKYRFSGTRNGQLQTPLGVCIDSKDNIIVADSGNGKVEAFSSQGRWLSTVVENTQDLGTDVKPVNVAVTPTEKVAVLLRGPYFAEIRVYSSNHQLISQEEGSVSTMSSVWYTKLTT